MARKMTVAAAAMGVLLLGAAPALAQEQDLAVRPGLWVTGFEFVGGDGDAVAEPGERLRLWVDLQHGGEAPVTDVSGVLRSLTDDVRVIEDAATWADIGSGDNARSRTAFLIEITETAKIQDTRCGGPVQVEPLPVDEPPADGGDDPVSDGGSGGGSVSSDGTVTQDPDGGGSDGSPGQSEPGYAGEGASPEELEAEQRTAEQEAAEREKAQAEEPVTPIEEGNEEPAPEPAEYEPGVHVSLSLAVSSSLGDEELFVDNGLVCTMLESGAGGDGADGEAPRDVALGADDKVASASRAPAIGSAAVLLGAMGLTLGSIAWRRRQTI